MKPALVTALVLLASAASAEEQLPIKAVVAGKVDGCLKDLGYVVKSGAAIKELDAEVRAKFPDAKTLFSKDNEIKDKKTKQQVWAGNYMVVVGGDYTDPKGCKGYGISVGFGKDEASARKNALDSLGKHAAWVKKADAKVLESRLVE
jgi:hypothetical protein